MKTRIKQRRPMKEFYHTDSGMPRMYTAHSEKMEDFVLVFKYPGRTFKEEIRCMRNNAIGIVKDLTANDSELKKIELWQNGNKIT